jgi:hypothetical protein
MGSQWRRTVRIAGKNAPPSYATENKTPPNFGAFWATRAGQRTARRRSVDGAWFSEYFLVPETKGEASKRLKRTGGPEGIHRHHQGMAKRILGATS